MDTLARVRKLTTATAEAASLASSPALTSTVHPEDEFVNTFRSHYQSCVA
jgi:hypothetical protein